MNSSKELCTISELTAAIKALLEEVFVDVSVVGEVSGLSRPRSGHLYFTLKDADAQCPAVIWRSIAARIASSVRDGESVVCRGRIEVYPPHGKYTLVITSLAPYGVGQQEQALRVLRQRLAAEGVFDAARKRPLPSCVKRVAVVTSLSGAAVRDFIQILTRRTRRIDLVLVPVRVQGTTAAAEIAAAMKLLATARNVDVIVLTRGGGSAEDLAAFNDEAVVRSVAASPIPVVSAIGHEIDVTLCDLAADLRALTPSEAAERIAPNDDAFVSHIDSLKRRFANAWESKRRLLAMRLERVVSQPIWRDPTRLFSMRHHALEDFERRLHTGINRTIERSNTRLATAADTLNNLSPLAVLARGYSLTLNADGHLITSAETVAIGEQLVTRLAHGEIVSRVEETC
ncbi:MAG: exodeoxyribonuclease VII large subunit [Thermoguttaceae bacterium]